MKIYQRFLSQSLIFFSMLFIIFLFFIESNIGFKYFFRFANRFFIELKVEKISGNWRDFLLENVKYDILGVSIKADSVHIKLDAQSLFERSTIFKQIDTKHVVLSLNNDISKNISKNNILSNILKNYGFIKYPIIFKKIHIDQFFLKSSQINMLFLNVQTGIKLIHNNIILSPTYIDNISIALPKKNSSRIMFSKKNMIKRIQNIEIEKFTNTTKKINNFVNFLSKKSEAFIPVNVNLKYISCKKIKFLNYKNFNLFQIELKAKLQDNILRIHKIKINSSFLKIYSFGKIIINHDASISSVINNQIIIPELNNTIINICLKFHLDKKFIFTLKSTKLYTFKINGLLLLHNSDYPFVIKISGKNLFLPIKNKYIFNNFHGLIYGNINNYFISLKNLFHVKELPFMVVDIKGQGNLKNIYLKKIKFISLKNSKHSQDIKPVYDNTRYHEHILELIGTINVLSNFNNNIKNLYIPNMNLNVNFMKKKLSVLGSLCYKNNNILEIPKINFFIGHNKLSLKGFLGPKYNIYSSINAYNLNYLSPHLQGKMKAKVNLYGNHNIFPIVTGNLLATHIGFHNFHIQDLYIKTYLHNKKQNIYFLLKNKKFYIHFLINGVFNKKIGIWHGVLKEINIQSLWVKLKVKKNILIDYYDINHNTNNFYNKKIQKKTSLSSIIYDKTLSYFHAFLRSPINITSQLFLKARLKSSFKKSISNGKIVLTGYNIELEKNQNQKLYLEKIDYLHIYMHLTNNNIKTQWKVKKNKKLSKDKIIYGYLNIINIYNQKNIRGKSIIINFPVSILNFFATNFDTMNGVFTSKIKFFGTINEPKVLADINFQDIFIRSDNILQYITLLFPYVPKKINAIKINQEIIINQGSILFKLYPYSKNPYNIEWHLVFKSQKISVLVVPKITITFSSELNLHYLLSKYDLIGFIKLSFFYFNINEKNFIF